jgi:hypothetical protein
LSPSRVGRSWPLLPLIILLVSSAPGCGDKGGGQSVVQQPSSSPAPAATDTAPAARTAPATTTPPATTQPQTTPATTTPTATTGLPPESQPGGAGDEQAARVPAAFTVAGATITPARITVPAFLAIELSITAQQAAQRVTVDAPGVGTIDVAAGGTARRQLAGLRPGDYRVTTARGGAATLHVVSGGAPGP